MIWLLSGLPALAVFSLVPLHSQLMAQVVPLLMILEISYFGQVARDAIKLKRATGQFPLGDRVKLVPFALSLLIYFLILERAILTELKIGAGCLAVLLGSISKIWIARLSLWPRQAALEQGN